MIEVLDALAGAEVDANASRIDLVMIEQVGIAERLVSGGKGEAGIDAGILPALRVAWAAKFVGKARALNSDTGPTPVRPSSWA